MSPALTPPQRDGVVAALAQLAAGRDHDWAARVLLEELAGPEGERPAWHVKHGRIEEAQAELWALLTPEVVAHV
jgi:hypothetical protein